MGSFYATTGKPDCLQMLYRYCKNWISVPNIVNQLTLSLRCKYWKIHSRSNLKDTTNSIRRSAIDGEAASGRRNDTNDVSLLWRHSSRSRSWQLERAYRRPFLTVFGNLNPKMLLAIVWTPKKHFLTSQRVFWTIVREIPCTGYFSRRVREKNK